MICITKYKTKWELPYSSVIPRPCNRQKQATIDSMNHGNSSGYTTNWNQITLDLIVSCSETPRWWKI